MNTHARSMSTMALGALLCATGIASLPGCEDAEAQQRAEAAVTIKQASQTLMQVDSAAVPGQERFSDSQQRLRNVVQDLQRVDGAGPGQQAAASSLSSSANRQLADMLLAEAAQLELEMADHRAAAVARLRSLIDLHSSSEAIREFQASLSGDLMQSARSSTEQQLAEASSLVSDLESPIDQTQQAIEQAQQQAEDLRQRANELLREASELGYQAGFPKYEEAYELHQQADKLSFQAAERQAELEYDLQAEHDSAQTRASYLQDHLQLFEQTTQRYQQLQQEFDTELSELRNYMDTLREEIAGSVTSMRETAAGDLSSLYEQAVQHAEAAVTHAQQAAGRARGGENAQSAQLLLARAHAALGKAHWTKARTLRRELDVLTALLQSPETIGDVSRYESFAEQVQQEYDAAIEQARTAYDEAGTSLQTAGNQPGVGAFAQSVNASLNALGGDAIAFDNLTPDAGSATSFQGSGQGSGQPFTSLDEMVSFMRSADRSNPSGLRRLLDNAEPENEAARQNLAMMRQLFETFMEIERLTNELKRAVERNFSAEEAQSFAQGFDMGRQATMQEGPLFTNVEILEQDDQSATIRVTAPGEAPDTLTVEQRDGNWVMMVSDDIFDDGMGEGGPGAAGGPEAAQMVQAMFQEMANTMRQLIQDIEAGRITNEQQLQQRMMESMFGGMGGEMMQGMEGMMNEMQEQFDQQGGNMPPGR